MSATLLLPAEIFVDHVLVLMRDSSITIPGSLVPLHEHARQAAALARQGGQADTGVAAALLYGVGYAMAASRERHPSSDEPITPTEMAAASLELHLPQEVVAPIRMLPEAQQYLDRHRFGLVTAPSGRRFETQRHAAAAIELAGIDRRAGLGPMLTPDLSSYRDMLAALCRRAAPT